MLTLSFSFSLKLFRRNSRFLIGSMSSEKSTVFYIDDPEHVAGSWYSVPQLRLRDHRFTLPLDHSHSQSPKISVFAREAVSVGKENQDMPYLLFLQGGPGFESPRPTEASGWLSKACEEHRVILMDQRGTGLSTPLTTSSMLQMKSAQELVDYLKYFRADNIVNDAEFIRKHLVPNNGPWKVLGQSFGGFCGVTYLSFAPQGLKEVYLTGGIPPIGDGCTAEAVYKACIGPIITQNEKYYKRYPQDIEIIRDVVNHLQESEGGGVPLPSGGILTPWGLQLLGLTGLGSSTGFERLHYLFERVWDPVIVPGAKKQISYYFLNAFEQWLSFDTNPLYALMHESIYCQGAASLWAAHRVRAEYEYKLDAVKATKEGRPVFFTGEMVFPWMFDEIHALRPFKEAANLLALKKDWLPLYNKATLNKNTVPVAAAVYYEDMFVNFNLAMETAAEIAGIRLWVTNEYMHSGLRDGATHVLDHLMGLLNGFRKQKHQNKGETGPGYANDEVRSEPEGRKWIYDEKNHKKTILDASGGPREPKALLLAPRETGNLPGEKMTRSRAARGFYFSLAPRERSPDVHLGLFIEDLPIPCTHSLPFRFSNITITLGSCSTTRDHHWSFLEVKEELGKP